MSQNYEILLAMADAMPGYSRQQFLADAKEALAQSSPLLDARQVAERLRISLPTVRRWKQDKRLRAVKVGGAVRFREADVLELIK